MSIRHLEHLLEPASVAVIGASERPGSVGSCVWRNLRRGAFTGPLVPVNHQQASVDGVATCASVSQLPSAPDLALVCTPAHSVPELIDALGRRGTRAAVVLSGGLDPSQRRAMLEAARPHLLRVLGPNCIGLLVPHLGLNASFAHADALPGSIAFVSQSGALVTSMLDWANGRGIGFSHVVSLGERADVDFGDMLDYLASEPRTRSILLYIESIEDPRKFMSAARAAARNKPVIVVKAGRAGQGVAAAASHTGAMAGSDVVFDAAIRRAGLLRVDSLQDLFIAAETLARFGANRDDHLTLMTNGGGAGVMAADAAARAGVPLAGLAPELRTRLDAVLPPSWSHANPVDIIGDAPVQRYVDTLQALLAQPDSGAVLFLHAPTAIVRSEDIARACAPLVRSAPGRVMACWLGDRAVASARRIFEAAGAADYETPEQAIAAFAMLGTYRRNQALLMEAPAAGASGAPDVSAARAIVAAALAGGRRWLEPTQARELLRAYRIPTLPERVVPPDAEAACAAARELGWPVAVKIVSPDITHKSDVGGVVLDVRDEAQLRAAATGMLARVRAARADARVEGFSLQPMLRRPKAVELIVGTSIDPVFGPVLLFGQGGTAVEVIADRAIGLPPLNRVLARELVGRTRVARLLQGWRDHPPVDMEALCDTLVALSQMLADLPELAELDINPLCADHDGVVALDARVRLDAHAGGGVARFAILPYPGELSRDVTWQGEALVIRPVRPEDGVQHRAFLDRVDAADLRLRFFHVRRRLSDSELARLTQIDYAREMTFIAERRPAGGVPETLGAVQAVVDPDNVEAEFAILVRSDQQGRGLGHLLLGWMVEYLQARGTQRLVAHVLRENRAMCDLAATHGFGVDAAHADREVVKLVRPLQGPGVVAAEPLGLLAPG